MKNIANTYSRLAYANSLIVCAYIFGTGNHATVSAVVFPNRAAAAAAIAAAATLEKVSPAYHNRTKKTLHYRLTNRAFRDFFLTSKDERYIAYEWKKSEWENEKETFCKEFNCVMTQKESKETGKKLFNAGHFGEYMVYKYIFGLEWSYNTLSYKKGADIETENIKAEIKTTTDGAAQWQPSINQYL